MNITQASKAIGEALQSGKISREVAIQAQAAIRSKSYYGNEMTGDSRKRMLVNRFGIAF